MTPGTAGATGVGVGWSGADQPLSWIALGLGAALVTAIGLARRRKSHVGADAQGPGAH
jgi:hypothetical protein